MSPQTPHPSVKELTAFSNGCLSIDDAKVVEIHIGECQPCCDTLLGLSDTDTIAILLKQIGGSIDSSNLDELHSEVNIEQTFSQHPRYRIVERIARGGMGDVYKAEHRNMGRIFC